MLGLNARARADPPPEIGKIRLVHAPVDCLAPQYLAEELLHSLRLEIGMHQSIPNLTRSFTYHVTSPF